VFLLFKKLIFRKTHPCNKNTFLKNQYSLNKIFPFLFDIINTFAKETQHLLQKIVEIAK